MAFRNLIEIDRSEVGGSVTLENIRKSCEEDAREEEIKLWQSYEQKFQALVDKNNTQLNAREKLEEKARYQNGSTSGGFLAAAAAVGTFFGVLLLADMFSNPLEPLPFWVYIAAIGAPIVVFLWVLESDKTSQKQKMNTALMNVGRATTQIGEQKEKLENEYVEKVRQIKQKYDERCHELIQNHKNNVNAYAKQIMMREDLYKGLVDWQQRMLEQVIKRADKDGKTMFVEAELRFEVTRNQILYYLYGNRPDEQNSCVFSQYGIPDLKNVVEIEGMAQAMTKLTMLRMISLSPPNTVKMTMGHQDARVKLTYRKKR